MSPQLDALTEKIADIILEGAYQVLRKTDPAITKGITRWIREGKTPEDIARFVQDDTGRFIVGAAATYIRDHLKELENDALLGLHPERPDPPGTGGH